MTINDREHRSNTHQAGYLAPRYIYMTLVRLNAVRKELLKADLGKTVAEVANHWGFWHMGQFAADYKQLFGELPLETRKRQYASQKQGGARIIV